MGMWIYIGCGITLLVALIVGFQVSEPVMNNAVMQVQCCDGKPCSDTYYTVEDNLCHLALCEGSWDLMFGKNCTYSGANKTIQLG